MVGGGQGTGKSMRMRLSKLPFSNLPFSNVPFSFSPKHININKFGGLSQDRVGGWQNLFLCVFWGSCMFAMVGGQLRWPREFPREGGVWGQNRVELSFCFSLFYGIWGPKVP